MTEPTPGPWRVEVYKVFGQSETCAVKGEGVLVCWPENPADAHLIAAAPAMLNALRLVVEMGDQKVSVAARLPRVIKAARAALKMAGE